MPPITIAGRTWHLCLQLLCFFKKAPAVHVTEAAKRQLESHLSRITEFRPAASILWGSNVVDGVTQPPQWGVAFYDIGTRPSGRVVQIGGLPFVFTQQRAYTHLEGATLDYDNGRFVVSESAPA
jgi:hypothetical protein